MTKKKQTKKKTPEFIAWQKEDKIRREKDAAAFKALLSRYETNPKTAFIDVFEMLEQFITRERNKYAERQDDDKLKSLYDLYRYKVKSLRDTTENNLKDVVLPELPNLIKDDYYTGLVHLSEYCEQAAKILVEKPLVPLSGNAEIVYNILYDLPQHKALKAAQILNIIAENHDKFWDEKELYDRVFPQLRPYGLKNKPRIGYWIEKEKSADTSS